MTEISRAAFKNIPIALQANEENMEYHSICQSVLWFLENGPKIHPTQEGNYAFCNTEWTEYTLEKLTAELQPRVTPVVERSKFLHEKITAISTLSSGKRCQIYVDVFLINVQKWVQPLHMQQVTSRFTYAFWLWTPVHVSCSVIRLMISVHTMPVRFYANPEDTTYFCQQRSWTFGHCDSMIWPVLSVPVEQFQYREWLWYWAEKA